MDKINSSGNFGNGRLEVVQEGSIDPAVIRCRQLFVLYGVTLIHWVEASVAIHQAGHQALYFLVTLRYKIIDSGRYLHLSCAAIGQQMTTYFTSTVVAYVHCLGLAHLMGCFAS